MTLRFWRPEGDPPGGELSLVAAVSSDQRLYIILEGPPLPPPLFPGDPNDRPEMLAVRITTASGVELLGGGTGDYGKEGRRPRTFICDTALPPDSSGPLNVQLRRENGSVIWESQVMPVADS